MSAVLILRSTGATLYPLGGERYLMCGTARDGKPYATVTTVAAPESLDEVTEFDVDVLLEHLQQAGDRIAEVSA